MAYYKKCPECGNTEEDYGIYKCKDCGKSLGCDNGALLSTNIGCFKGKFSCPSCGGKYEKVGTISN